MTQTTIQGLDALNRKLKNLEQFQKHLRDPMEQSLALLQDEIATAPRKVKTAFKDLATPKQKRAYWARVRSGQATHLPGTGYKRGGSGKAWTTDIDKTQRGLRGTVGNVKSHMRFVQGKQQQPFHKRSGWRTTDEVVKKNSRKIQGFFSRKVKKILSK